MIRCEQVGKKYKSKWALNNFNFEFIPGHIYALLGPNGSGKSTLMKSVAGLVKPNSGTIYFENEPLNYTHKAQIAYMPTEAYFYNYMTAMQAAKYYQDFFTDFNIDKFLYVMNIMNLNPEQKIKEYSSGMMAKFKVALNISRNPKVLMLDEPLNGIDMIAREEVLNNIVMGINSDSVVMISSHLIDELEKVADYALFIREGSLAVCGEIEMFREQYGKSMEDIYREVYAGLAY